MKILNIYDDDNERPDVQVFIAVKKLVKTLNMMYVQDENNVLVWNYDGFIEIRNHKKPNFKIEFDGLVQKELPKEVRKLLNYVAIKTQ